MSKNTKDTDARPKSDCCGGFGLALHGDENDAEFKVKVREIGRQILKDQTFAAPPQRAASGISVGPNEQARASCRRAAKWGPRLLLLQIQTNRIPAVKTPQADIRSCPVRTSGQIHFYWTRKQVGFG
jgi:hypothetical protein